MDTSLYELFYSLEDTHWWFQGRKDLVLGLLRRYGRCSRPHILDVGCGTGGMLAYFSRLGPSLGVDTAEEAAYFCRRRGLSMIRGSGTTLPLADASFDVVSALDVIEHVDDDGLMLRELRRVCRPGGILLLTVPAFQFLWSSHDDLNHHRRRYIRRDLADRVEAGGFTPLKLSYYNSFLFPAAIVRKFLLGRNSNGTACHLESLPGAMNTIFRRILSSERPLITNCEFPIGASLICAARKNGSSNGR